MAQRIGDTLVVLLGKSYFIRRQKCSQFSEPYVRYISRSICRSSTIIKYIFNSFLFSKSSLNEKLLNIYLIEVH